ncbi:hypothetical protein FRUB_04916 [Fimbriiglobus ruber]|uniref:Uncharacterized protein n=1 Tax=Fimbriiglobus ruber TaxID=1908690 RepID=A0A225DN03_9BACT|nr:hypothetical protein FRUB_04916 [Fimbriiglobus ruber]
MQEISIGVANASGSRRGNSNDSSHGAERDRMKTPPLQ